LGGKGPTGTINKIPKDTTCQHTRKKKKDQQPKNLKLRKSHNRGGRKKREKVTKRGGGRVGVCWVWTEIERRERGGKGVLLQLLLSMKTKKGTKRNGNREEKEGTKEVKGGAPCPKPFPQVGKFRKKSTARPKKKGGFYKREVQMRGEKHLGMKV